MELLTDWVKRRTASHGTEAPSDSGPLADRPLVFAEAQGPNERAAFSTSVTSMVPPASAAGTRQQNDRKNPLGI